MLRKKVKCLDKLSGLPPPAVGIGVLVVFALVLMLGSHHAGVSWAGPDPEITPIAEPAWKMYFDTEYGFWIRYPSTDWTVHIAFQNVGKPEYVIRRRVTFFGPAHAVVNVDIWDNTSKLDLMEWFNQHQRPFLSEDVGIPSRAEAHVAGVPAVFVVQPQNAQAPARVSAILQKDSVTFRIEYIASDGGLSQDVYRDILSSFEFAAAQDTLDVLPPAPFFPVSGVQPLGDQDCCGYHDSQYNPYSCYSGNCTWWASYRRSDLPYQNQNWGNASDWTRRADEEGFTVNNTPATGALGGTPRSGYVRPYWENHVAYAESFDGSRIYFSDMDYGDWDCYVDYWYQYDWSGIEFIHSRGGDTTPPDGDITSPGEGDTITSRTVHLAGWAEDNPGGSGFNHAHFTAYYNNTWRQVGADFYSSPFGFDWDMCNDGVPDGEVTIGLDIWDNAGNPAYSPRGNRHFTKRYDCRPPEPPKPNLTPYTPSGWDFPLVPSSSPGTHTVDTLYADQPTYIDLAVINNGEASTSGEFYIRVYEDGNQIGEGSYSSDLPPGWYVYLEDWAHTFSAGYHTLKMVVDPTGAIDESNEGDNSWERQFYWETTTLAEVELVNASDHIVKPNEQFDPSITVRVTSGSLEPSRGDHLRDIGGLTFGAWPVQPVNQVVNSGQTYTFDVNNDPSFRMTAPPSEGTWQSWWRMRVGGEDIGPAIAIDIMVDGTPPTGAITSPAAGSYVNYNNVTVTATASDNLSGVGCAQFWVHYDDTEYWHGLPQDCDDSDGWSTTWDATGIPDQVIAFYLRLFDRASNRTDSSIYGIKLDRTPPSSHVNPLPATQVNTTFTVSWTAEDPIAGLDYCEIQYRDGAGGTWTDWKTDTCNTSAEFTGQQGHTYYFRSRATDLAGNVEAYPSGDGDTFTTVVELHHHIFLPLILKH